MKSIVLLLFSLCLLPIIFLTASAVPPIEKIPLTNISVSGMSGESIVLKSDEQVVITTEYPVNYPNIEYVIIFQITNERGQVVSLNWIEGLQNNLINNPESYVCGDEICPGNPSSSKIAETSWLPSESGIYEIVIFAWESVENPTALSPPSWIEVTVE